MDLSRPVLLIDGASRGDIGVVRSLGLGGVPVYLLGSDSKSPTAASRFVRRRFAFPPWSASDAERIAAVAGIVAAAPARPVMLASGDRSMSFLSRCRAELEPLLDHDLAPVEVIDTCLDKDRFGPEATRLGLPVPRTFAPDNIAAARRLLPSLAYPVFVKPVDRAEWDRLPAGTVDQVKGQRVDSAARMAALLDALDRAGASRFVIQSFVPGADSEHMSVHAYVRRDGTALEAFTGSKLRIWPPHAGVGAQVLSKRIPEVVPVALQALRALRYTGFAILQFKRNAGSGVYELLEINCRYSTWTELPTRAGCNFPLAAYATITGQAPPHIHQREGISWLDVERDLKAMSTYRASGEWTWGAYLKSLSTVRCWAYFAWDDPLPFVRKLLRRGDS